MLLGLDYWAWAITVPLILIDWPAAHDRLQVWRARRAAAGTVEPAPTAT